MKLNGNGAGLNKCMCMDREGRKTWGRKTCVKAWGHIATFNI